MHDVGHPPFAHAGEEELDRQMQRFGETFNHNVHALRVVDAFEQRYARFPGLNLTFEVREGIVKHSRDLTPGADPHVKISYGGRTLRDKSLSTVAQPGGGGTGGTGGFPLPLWLLILLILIVILLAFYLWKRAHP